MQDIIKTILLIIFGLVVGQLLPSYFRKKGENIATKEDVKEITNRMEAVRSAYAKQLEYVRTELQRQSDLVSRKRSVYTRLAKSMRVFIEASDAKQLKEEFLSDFSELWIWASDDVVTSTNIFIDSQIKHSEQPGSVSQAEMKQLYIKAMLAMRRDAGFDETNLTSSDFRFLKFKNEHHLTTG
jgi:hypothetical protein